MQYAYGTSLTLNALSHEWTAAVVMCSDGKRRAVSRIAPAPDTWSSIPATVRVAGKSVSGFVIVETADGFATDSDTDPPVAKFIAYQYGKNGGLLPAGAWKRGGDTP